MNCGYNLLLMKSRKTSHHSIKKFYQSPHTLTNHFKVSFICYRPEIEQSLFQLDRTQETEISLINIILENKSNEIEY